MNIEFLRRALENAPSDPGPIANELQGWTVDNSFAICAMCAGRLYRRGIGIPNREPVLAPDTLQCSLCGK